MMNIERETFQLVSDPTILLSILCSRIPRSVNVYNMVKLYGSFTDEMNFYKLAGTDVENTCWILGKYKREDTGQQFVVSIPNGLTQIPPQVESIFANVSLEVINWDAQFEFIGTDRIVTELISKILLQRGNAHELMPCQFFYFPRDAVAQTAMSENPAAFKLMSLNSPAGIKYLLTRHWYYNANTEAYRTKCVERCPSVGAYDNSGDVASGAIVNPTGHVGIVTLENHQRKGLSLACLRKLLHLIEQNTELIPCSMVDLKNQASIGLHVKAGHQPTHVCDFIFYKR